MTVVDPGATRARILRRTAAAANVDAIEAALHMAETQAREFGVASLLPWIFEERAALALGDESRRRAALDDARRPYAEIGAIGHLQRLRKGAGQ